MGKKQKMEEREMEVMKESDGAGGTKKKSVGRHSVGNFKQREREEEEPEDELHCCPWGQ